jgi:hypothetical protein
MQDASEPLGRTGKERGKCASTHETRGNFATAQRGNAARKGAFRCRWDRKRLLSEREHIAQAQVLFEQRALLGTRRE